MEDVSSGLQFYSQIKNGFGLLFLLGFCICLSFFYFNLLGKNYIQANNAHTSFKHFNIGVPSEDCSINAPDPDCQYIDEYTDKNSVPYVMPVMVADPKKPPTVGNVTLFYEEKNPTNYVKSPIQPANGVLIFLVIIIILLILASINLYLVSTYKTYGAVMGGIDATHDVMSMFKSK